jgi:hypothetical protein
MMATAHQGYSDCAKIDRSRTNPLGVKGVGEIGIVGTAAIANAAFHATGMRVRDLPTPSTRFSGFGKALPGQGRRDGPDVDFWPFNDIAAAWCNVRLRTVFGHQPGQLRSQNDPKRAFQRMCRADFRGEVARTSAVFCASVSSSPTWLLDASFLARPQAAHRSPARRPQLCRAEELSASIGLIAFFGIVQAR